MPHPAAHRRYAASLHAKELRSFANWLDEIGYGRDPAQDHVRRLGDALDRSGGRLNAHIDHAGVNALFALLPDVAKYRATRRAFCRYLEAHGRLLAEADRRTHAAVMVAYEDQLMTVRGLSTSTVAQHVATIQSFLQEALPNGLPISALTRECIERHLVTASRRISRQSLQHWVARLWSFLRFCYSNALLTQPIDAIDTPRVYRDELSPRAQPWKIVIELLRSIDRSDAVGCPWASYPFFSDAAATAMLAAVNKTVLTTSPL